MYADFRVEIPNEVGKITRKTIKGTTDIYYQTDRIYHSDKKYSQPKATTIGKMCEDDSSMMIPNDKYMIFFPEAALPEAKAASSRSACLRVGTYMVICKIIAEYGLDTMLKEVLGGGEDLFLDLATYSIIAENNAGQYYPDYAYNHPLFTEDMKIYRDSKVSSFINGIKKEQSVEFLKRWNESVTHKNRIYISYDSTNKNCQVGDIDLAEFGHAKDDKSKPIINYSVGYDRTNRIPLWYEAYAGSILLYPSPSTLQKVDGLGYKRIGFILDRGYFSKENIHEMDRMGYGFIIMMKGKKALVSDRVMEVKGIFEEDRRCGIRDYKVSGTTVKRQLYPSDEKERYFHIYCNESKRITEREHLEAKIDQLGELLQEKQGTIGYECPRAICEYFDPVYHTKREVKTFVSARERTDVINREIALCGYFVIITSEKMTAEEALEEYKSRDASEKLFRGDKSYLGNRSCRVHSTESVENKIFIEFVALIIRNKIYTSLKDQMRMNKKKDNYMTVPAAIKELEKMEMIRLSDGNYCLEHAVTSTQKEILKAFNLTGRNVQEQAIGINEELRMIRERK